MEILVIGMKKQFIDYTAPIPLTTDPPSKQNMISEYSFYVSISHRISMYPTLGAVWWPEGGWEDVVVIISL